jgi:hypothetical protein
VEGESIRKLTPGVQEKQRSDDSDLEDSDAEVNSGTVYRLVKGHLKKLEGGMEQYTKLASSAAAKLSGTRR